MSKQEHEHTHINNNVASSFSQLICVFCSLLRQNAQKFLMEDLYRNPGPLQYDGPGADAKAVSLCVEDQDYMGRIKKLQEYLDQVIIPIYLSFFLLCFRYFVTLSNILGAPQVRTIVKPGCSQDVLKAALSVMASVTDVLTTISSSSNGGQQFA